MTNSNMNEAAALDDSSPETLYSVPRGVIESAMAALGNLRASPADVYFQCDAALARIRLAACLKGSA